METSFTNKIGQGYAIELIRRLQVYNVPKRHAPNSPYVGDAQTSYI